MEIRVRNVEPIVGETINNLARKNGFVKQSGEPNREEFLRWHFRQMAMLEEVSEIENKYYDYK